MSSCRDDLTAITRYVTWNLDDRGSGALSRALPDQTDLVAVYQVAVDSSGKEDAESEEEDQQPVSKKAAKSKAQSSGALAKPKPLKPMHSKKRNVDRDYQNLIQLMEDAVMTRDPNRTNLVVGGLVQHIVSHWREQFCKTVTAKFNCYFMLPFVDELHRYLRKELQKVYDGEGDDVFDLTSARTSLLKHREELMNECIANKRLQEKFQVCAKMMKEEKGAKDSVFDKPSRHTREEYEVDDR